MKYFFGQEKMLMSRILEGITVWSPFNLNTVIPKKEAQLVYTQWVVRHFTTVFTDEFVLLTQVLFSLSH